MTVGSQFGNQPQTFVPVEFAVAPQTAALNHADRANVVDLVKVVVPVALDNRFAANVSDFRTGFSRAKPFSQSEAVARVRRLLASWGSKTVTPLGALKVEGWVQATRSWDSTTSGR